MNASNVVPLKGGRLPVDTAAYRAWAIWNPCQGVFTSSVFHSKIEAEHALQSWVRDDPTFKVVPVTMVVDHEEYERNHGEALL